MFNQCLDGIKKDINTVLLSTKHRPTIHTTADKGQGLKKKVELGRVVYVSQADRMLVSKPLICNELLYKDGEKSGTALHLASRYKKLFTRMNLMNDLQQRWKSSAFDNEYFKKNVVGEIKRMYKLNSVISFAMFRDICHNVNLKWNRCYANCKLIQISVNQMRDIINPLNHGAVDCLVVTDRMDRCSLSFRPFSMTKWIQHQRKSYFNFWWMAPALLVFYLEQLDELYYKKNKKASDAMSKHAQEYQEKILNLECGSNRASQVLMHDLGLPDEIITKKNESIRHEHFYQAKDYKSMMKDLYTRKQANDELIKSHSNIHSLLIGPMNQFDDFLFIHPSVQHLYPLTSLLYVENNRIKMKIDMETLNRMCPQFLPNKKPKKMSVSEWNQQIEQRNALRNKVISYFDDTSLAPTICKLPMSEYCIQCDIGKYTMSLIECSHCKEYSHLECNDITDHDIDYYKDNNLDFYCNKCKHLYVPDETQTICSFEMSETIKSIKKLNKEDVEQEMIQHQIFNDRHKMTLAKERFKLIKHYKTKHFIKYKKPRKKAKKKQKKIVYEKLQMRVFINYFHVQHGNILQTLIDASNHYVDRIPNISKLCLQCWDFKSFREEYGRAFGQICTQIVKFYKLIGTKRAILENEESTKQEKESANDEIKKIKNVLKRLRKCDSLTNALDKIIEGALPAFIELVSMYNKENKNKKDEIKDIVSCKRQYYNLLYRIFGNMLTGDLAKRFYAKKEVRNGYCVMCHSLNEDILFNKDLYFGNEDAVHIFENMPGIGADACESTVEGDMSQMQLSVHGRHLYTIGKWWNEYVITTECKNEHQEKTKHVLSGSSS